jgi:hypothetical protein
VGVARFRSWVEACDAHFAGVPASDYDVDTTDEGDGIVYHHDFLVM